MNLIWGENSRNFSKSRITEKKLSIDLIFGKYVTDESYSKLPNCVSDLEEHLEKVYEVVRNKLQPFSDRMKIRFYAVCYYESDKFFIYSLFF